MRAFPSGKPHFLLFISTSGMCAHSLSCTWRMFCHRFSWTSLFSKCPEWEDCGRNPSIHFRMKYHHRWLFSLACLFVHHWLSLSWHLYLYLSPLVNMSIDLPFNWFTSNEDNRSWSFTVWRSDSCVYEFMRICFRSLFLCVSLALQWWLISKEESERECTRANVAVCATSI